MGFFLFLTGQEENIPLPSAMLVFAVRQPWICACCGGVILFYSCYTTAIHQYLLFIKEWHFSHLSCLSLFFEVMWQFSSPHMPKRLKVLNISPRWLQWQINKAPIPRFMSVKVMPRSNKLGRGKFSFVFKLQRGKKHTHMTNPRTWAMTSL